MSQSNHRKTIVAVYDNQQEAQRAVEALHKEGFANDQISLVAGDPKGEYAQTNLEEEASGAGQGAVTGGILGGIAGLVVGLVGLTIPGVGPIVAAGPIATTLGGAALGAVTGGIVGALNGLGIPESEAHLYAEGVRRGSTIVGVTVPDKMVDKATTVLDRFDPIDIDERAATWRKDGWERFDEKAKPMSVVDIDKMRTARTANTDKAIPVVQEEMVVGKKDVARGKVRVRSFMVSEPVKESVTLREEHVNVERRPVDREVTTGDAAFKEQSFTLEEHAEQAVVGKKVKVVEEVLVGKESTTHTETVTDEVRHTEVEVTRDGKTVPSKQPKPVR